MSAADRKKWDRRYTDEASIPSTPSVLLTGLHNRLPTSGAALDIAGGGGRHAIWLAQHGLDATLVDISPLALELARRRADQAKVTLTTVARDLEHQPLPAGPWNVIVSFHYLQRSLFEQFPRLLAPGGWLVFLQPTATNLQRHEKPPAAFLLADGEAPSLVTGLEIETYREGWLEEDRHDALVVARAPGSLTGAEA